MAEIWDAYDVKFNKIENIELVRGQKIPNGLYHLVCEIAVKHKDGTYLLMQRDLRKHLGGLWELSAGGSALAGETPLICAMRELKEETGIVSDNFTEIGRFLPNGFDSHYVEFLCITDCPKDSIVLQDGETIAYKWVDRDTLINMDKNELAATRTLKILKDKNL